MTCRSLLKRGWIELAKSGQGASLYVISADGRRELEASGLRQPPQTEAAAPANIKF